MIPTSLNYPDSIEFLAQLNLYGRANLPKLPNPIPHPRRLSKDPAILPKLTPDLSAPLLSPAAQSILAGLERMANRKIICNPYAAHLADISREKRLVSDLLRFEHSLSTLAKSGAAGGKWQKLSVGYKTARRDLQD